MPAVAHLSVEAGLLSKKYPASPWSLLADATAFLIAKNADDVMKNGGSPRPVRHPGQGHKIVVETAPWNRGQYIFSSISVVVVVVVVVIGVAEVFVVVTSSRNRCRSSKRSGTHRLYGTAI